MLYLSCRKKMKNKIKTKSKTSFFKRLSKWWFAILVFGYVFYEGGKQTYINYNLNKNGICTRAIVYSRNKVGGRGKIDTRYSFEWKNNKYSGSSNSDDKYKETDDFFKTDDDLIIGDTIIVVFLESNPEINRSNSIVEKNCD